MTTYIDFSCQNMIVNVEKHNFFYTYHTNLIEIYIAILWIRYIFFVNRLLFLFSFALFFIDWLLILRKCLSRKSFRETIYPEILCILEEVFHYELHKGLEHCGPLWVKIQKLCKFLRNVANIFIDIFSCILIHCCVLWNIIKVRT